MPTITTPAPARGRILATPTWKGLLPLWLVIYGEGGEKGRVEAAAELMRMAEAADKWNAHCAALQAVEEGFAHG